MSYNYQLPPDPFEHDPNDPASFIEDDFELPELTAEDRLNVLQDLELTQEFKRHLSPRGILGVTFICDDCSEEHYYDWDIMLANMRAVLDGVITPVHEPSARPDPSRYAPWDYCLGYLDGIRANQH